jgi:uncharacterized protein (DUF1330 family)
MAKPAYMVFGVDIDDSDKFRQYGEGAAPLLVEFDASVLAATNNVEILDGSWERQRATVLKFPSVNEARALWESPQYAPLKTLRESCSRSDIVLVEGMADEDPDAASADEGVAHYMLGGNDTLGDTAWITEYQAKVPPISAKYGLEALVISDQFEILDGSWPVPEPDAVFKEICPVPVKPPETLRSWMNTAWAENGASVAFYSYCRLSNLALARSTFASISSADLVHTIGFGCSLWWER